MLPAFMPYFLDEQPGDRRVASFRFADLAAQRLDLAAGVPSEASRTACPAWNREREPSVPMLIEGVDVGIARDDAHSIPPAR